MGSLRNQVGAILEILKTGSYAANFAFVPAGGTGLDSASPGGIGTPLLDQLGPLEDFQSLSSATLPEVSFGASNPRAWGIPFSCRLVCYFEIACPALPMKYCTRTRFHPTKFDSVK